MNSVHASRFPRFRVLISAKRSEKACRCTVMWVWVFLHYFPSSFSISSTCQVGHLDLEILLLHISSNFCDVFCWTLHKNYETVDGFHEANFVAFQDSSEPNVAASTKRLAGTRNGGTKTMKYIRDLDSHSPSPFYLQRVLLVPRGGPSCRKLSGLVPVFNCQK